MKAKVDLEKIYAPSEEIVAREIEGEVIIVPITAGIGDMEDELFTLNETGKVIWRELDGKKSLQAVIEAVSADYEGPRAEIEKDVAGLVQELLERRMLVEVHGS
jgi:hypothetical protein